MSLDWDLSKVKDMETVCFEFNKGPGETVAKRHLNPITEAIIWGTIAIEMGQITEKNYYEFWMRLSMNDLVYGPRIGYRKGSRSITLEEVRKHIGLSTNVGTKPVTQMYKRLLKEVERSQQKESAA